MWTIKINFTHLCFNTATRKKKLKITYVAQNVLCRSNDFNNFHLGSQTKIVGFPREIFRNLKHQYATLNPSYCLLNLINMDL